MKVGKVIFGGIGLFLGIQLCLSWQSAGHTLILSQAQKQFFPVFVYANEKTSWNLQTWMQRQVSQILPMEGYIKNIPIDSCMAVEDEGTYQLLQAMHSSESAEEQETAPSVKKNEVLWDLEFEEVLRRYYTVDSTTMIYPSDMNLQKMLNQNMKIDSKEEGPKVLIFHTHSQEAFQDSKKGDTATTIVGMGAYLSELLNKRGIETMHHDGVYDLVNGQMDRSKAYELSEVGVRKILEKYPSIEVVIDLHRDGVKEETHLVTEINHKKTAKIMFFNGLSRTKTNGDITSLPNPYIQDNLAFSLQMQLAAEKRYPGFARKIYLKAYRYSLHMKPKSLLIEAGAQNNTVQEMRNAMEYLADILVDVLTE